MLSCNRINLNKINECKSSHFEIDVLEILKNYAESLKI